MSNATLRLKDRVAFVSGGLRGIGRACVERFLAEGAQVVLSDLDSEADAASAMAAFGERASYIRADVTSEADWQRALDAVTQRHGSLHVLVNNAGAAWGAEFEDFPEVGWDKVMDINVKSPFFLTQALHGLLKAGGSHDRPAKVINIGSIDGMRLNPWEPYSYHASKAAILYLTKRLAARLVTDHILVTAIAPGAFQSDMNKAARDHAETARRSAP